MHHTLNKRIRPYASQTTQQTDLPQKLQTRNASKQEKFQNSPDEGRRQAIELHLELEELYLSMANE